jgi:hypothetical protein
VTGTVWIPEAEDLAAAGTSGAMLGGPPRVVWHTTEAPSGKTAAGRDYFDLMHRVLTGKQAEPHILYDPLTDRLGQYFPLNRSARALRNDTATGTSTNKTGEVCIQIEVVGYASKPFTSYWKPGPNFAALMRAIRSWGIPDVWPGGGMSRAGESVSRSLTTWKTRAGHYGHCHVPGNTHWDCGAIDQQALLRTSPAPKPTPEPEGFLMALSDAQQQEIYAAARALNGNLGTFIKEIPSRVVTYVGKVSDVEVDEQALAAELAPLLVAQTTSLSDADLARIASAVADEQARRQAA